MVTPVGVRANLQAVCKFAGVLNQWYIKQLAFRSAIRITYIFNLVLTKQQQKHENSQLHLSGGLYI